MNIFFDLDGTLLDSRERLYKLFQHLVPESSLSFNEYWRLKRNKIAHREILIDHFSYSDEAFFLFDKIWMESIELPEWLLLDITLDGVTNYLKELKNFHSLYVVTARQYETVAIQQIEQHGWSNIFKKILVTGQKKTKFEMINTEINITKNDWIVGDTGDDILTGKQLRINTAAVLSGFMNKKKLQEYHPDVIVNSLLDLAFKSTLKK